MAFWAKYDIYEPSAMTGPPMFKYLQFPKEGVKAWFRYQKCRRWYGEHEFDETPTQYPTIFRPKVCKRCETAWRQCFPIPPPPTYLPDFSAKYVILECPHCYGYVEHDPRKPEAKCIECSTRFEFEPR